MKNAVASVGKVKTIFTDGGGENGEVGDDNNVEGEERSEEEESYDADGKGLTLDQDEFCALLHMLDDDSADINIGSAKVEVGGRWGGGVGLGGFGGVWVGLGGFGWVWVGLGGFGWVAFSRT